MKTPLEIIFDSLDLPDEQKAELYNNLRSLNIKSDCDPLLKITLVLSIIAKFTEEIPEKISYERQLLENILNEQRVSSDSLSDNISKLTEAVHRSNLDQSVKPLTQKRPKLSFSRNYIVVLVLTIFLGIVFNYYYSSEPIEKTYRSRTKFLEKCSKTPEIFKVDNKGGWYLTIEPGSVVKLQNGQTAAQLKGYY
jgi:hypothetical protein